MELREALLVALEAGLIIEARGKDMESEGAVLYRNRDGGPIYTSEPDKCYAVHGGDWLHTQAYATAAEAVDAFLASAALGSRFGPVYPSTNQGPWRYRDGEEWLPLGAEESG